MGLTEIFAIIKAIPVLDRWFQEASAIYWAWRFNRDQADYYKAKEKARTQENTEDLQKALGKHLVLLPFLALMTMGASQCHEGEALKSFCTPNFEDGMCWVNKEKGKGFTFKEMAFNQKHCREMNDQGERAYPNTPCWYAIDENDLDKVVTKLNSCGNKQEK